MSIASLEERVAALEVRLNSSVPEHLIGLYERTNKLFTYSQNVKSQLDLTTKAHNRHVLAAEHPKDVRAGWPRRVVQANRTWAKRSRNTY